MTSLVLLATCLIGSPGSPSSPAAVALRAGGARWESPVFAAQAPADNAAAAEAVQRRRSHFVACITRGVFERFDDARQEVVFKRNDPSRALHEPGPLEDEAIASAAREAIATAAAMPGLKARIACHAGRVSISALPDDPVAAAALVDIVLGLDGVQTVAAVLPPSLRLP